MMRATLAAIALVATSLGPQAPASANAAIPRSDSITAVAVSSTGGSWTTYHHDDAHTGFDSSAPAISSVGPTPGWTEASLDGEVYAEPLVFAGRVYTATLNNTVYALDQASGAVVWSLHLGAPQAGGWVCGNVSPMGILGTPVIDVAAGRIYVAAQFGSDHLYRVYGLNLVTGAVELTTVIPTAIGRTGFDWKIQQERGALAVANGYVYVPFGGRAGDCFDGTTPYYGWVVGVPTDGVSPLKVFQTPSGAESVWAPGGVVVDDTSHNVFFATGNAIPCSGSTYSDAIVRTGPTLASPSFFEPNDWQANWCGPDSDLGSTSPTLISPNLMFAAGKRGGGFLLDPTNLGGVNGQVFPSPTNYQQAEVCLGNHSAATYGSFAYAAPYLYLECEGRGIVALAVNTTSRTFTPCGASCPAPDWRAGAGITFGPPIVASGAVWAAADGGGLYAFNTTTGAQVFHSAGFGVNRFVTPSEAGGQVFVPSHTVIKSFSIGGSVTVSPSRLDFGGHVPGTTSSPMQVTLRNSQPATLNVAAATLTGANAGQYLKGTDTCTGAALAAGASCTVQVSFKPTRSGGLPAAITFTDDGVGNPQSAALEGLGAIDNQGHLYTLDGYGGVHPDAGAPPLASSAYWSGFNIARSLALFPDGLGGYKLDGFGGLHPVGNAAAPFGYAYFGFDIARQVVMAPWSSNGSPAGWTLDGYGGVHPFGGAPGVGLTAYYPGQDLARGLVILPDSTPTAVAGYTLDAYGGIHPFGGAPAVANSGYWPGFDIARGIALSPNAAIDNPAGWVLDGYGGIHAFGTAPALANPTYFGFDIGRGLVTWTGAGSGGWLLDGYGGIHPVGAAPSLSSYPYWPGLDIAASLAGPDSNSGSRHHS
jgi:outer membrane protein assembly factor BamB